MNGPGLKTLVVSSNYNIYRTQKYKGNLQQYICVQLSGLIFQISIKILLEKNGENGQIPPFSENCSKKALFWNLLGKYHFYGT